MHLKLLIKLSVALIHWRNLCLLETLRLQLHTQSGSTEGHQLTIGSLLFSISKFTVTVPSHPVCCYPRLRYNSSMASWKMDKFCLGFVWVWLLVLVHDGLAARYVPKWKKQVILHALLCFGCIGCFGHTHILMQMHDLRSIFNFID